MGPGWDFLAIFDLPQQPGVPPARIGINYLYTDTNIGEILMSTSKPRSVILSEDGELRPTDADTDGETAAPDAHSGAVFCTECGTANRASSRFCRTCGQSLDEQAVNPASLGDYAAPEWKNKRAASSAPQGEHLTQQEMAVMVEVLTLIVLGVLAGISIASQQTWIAIILLLIWLVSKISRRGPLGGH